MTEPGQFIAVSVAGKAKPSVHIPTALRIWSFCIKDEGGAWVVSFYLIRYKTKEKKNHHHKTKTKNHFMSLFSAMADEGCMWVQGSSRFNLSSQLNSLLEKESFTLEQVLQEDELVQEVKTRNTKLIELYVLDTFDPFSSIYVGGGCIDGRGVVCAPNVARTYVAYPTKPRSSSLWNTLYDHLRTRPTTCVQLSTRTCRVKSFAATLRALPTR